jgi:PLP dependent protein
VARVRDRVALAARRAGRADEVRLIGITKGVAGDVVALAGRAGLKEFGENYVQELVAKRSRAPDAIWHFVGRVQRNKVNRILENADVVQTLEPGAAADRLARMAGERPIECLVEVDFTGTRVGVGPREAPAFVERMAARPGLRVRGLMTVAPPHEDPRRAFVALRQLRDRLQERLGDVRELSMGMSADLEAAVEEGATMVRVGTAIFGPREVEGR